MLLTYFISFIFFLPLYAKIKHFEVTRTTTSSNCIHSRTFVFTPLDFQVVSYPIINFIERSHTLDDTFFTTLANAGFIVFATFHPCENDQNRYFQEWLRTSQFHNHYTDRFGVIASSGDEIESDDVVHASVILGPLRARDLNSPAPMFFVGNQSFIIQPVLYKRTNSNTILPKKRNWRTSGDYTLHVADFFRCHLSNDQSSCETFHSPNCKSHQICTASQILSTARRRRRLKKLRRSLHALAGPVHPDHIATHSPEEIYYADTDLTDLYANYECTNDLSSRDSQGRNCDDWYDEHRKDCGKYDVINKGFTARTQCCTCYNIGRSIRGEPWEYPDNTMSPSVDSEDHNLWPWKLPPIVYTWQFGIGAGFFVGILLACMLIRLCDTEPPPPNYDQLLEQKRKARLRQQKMASNYKKLPASKKEAVKHQKKPPRRSHPV